MNPFDEVGGPIAGVENLSPRLMRTKGHSLPSGEAGGGGGGGGGGKELVVVM